MRKMLLALLLLALPIMIKAIRLRFLQKLIDTTLLLPCSIRRQQP